MIRTNTREVRLEFHTDNAIELLGFRVNYTTTSTFQFDALFIRN